MVGLTARRWHYGVAHWSFASSGMGSWWPLSPIRDATWTLMHERDQWINENSGEMQAGLVCCALGVTITRWRKIESKVPHANCPTPGACIPRAQWLGLSFWLLEPVCLKSKWRLALDSYRRAATVALKLTLHESYRVNPPSPSTCSFVSQDNENLVDTWHIGPGLYTCRMQILTCATACISRKKKQKRGEGKNNENALLPTTVAVFLVAGRFAWEKEAIDCGAKGDPGIALHEAAGATGKRTNMAALCLSVSFSQCFFFILFLMLVSFFKRLPSHTGHQLVGNGAYNFVYRVCKSLSR